MSEQIKVLEEAVKEVQATSTSTNVEEQKPEATQAEPKLVYADEYILAGVGHCLRFAKRYNPLAVRASTLGAIAGTLLLGYALFSGYTAYEAMRKNYIKAESAVIEAQTSVAFAKQVLAEQSEQITKLKARLAELEPEPEPKVEPKAEVAQNKRTRSWNEFLFGWMW